MTDPAITESPGSPAGQPGLRRTPLTGIHAGLGATLTDFAGWLMPLRYGSETAEHNAVRSAAGLFDLSHMGELAVTGPGAADALDYALTGNLGALAPGRARYTVICADDGGVLDDLVVYRLAAEEFLVVANAANAPAVFALLSDRAAKLDAVVSDRGDDYALIAIQGPRAAAILGPLTDADLAQVKYYASYPATVAGASVLLARTGYTGEDGFEIFAPPGDATAVWTALSAAGADHGLVPAGTPYDAGLDRLVRLDKAGDFVGRAALAARAQAAPQRRLVGLIGESRRVPRHGYSVLWDGVPVGAVTSGAPSPTLGAPIAMAYISPAVADDAAEGGAGRLAVDIRGRAEPARLVPLPFYRRPA